MEVVIASSFFASVQKLATRDRARVMDFLAKLHANPSAPGLNLEKVRGARDPGMRSARITQGQRAIVHVEGARFTLLYAAQHDDAYRWAESRRVGAHPVTGVVQIVESAGEVEKRLRREQEILLEGAQPLFRRDRLEDAYLLSLGVPGEWLPTVRLIRNEDELLDVVEKLPQEVAERLLELAEGKLVTPPEPVAPGQPIAASPDNLRRFCVVEEGDLADWLNKPWDAWLRFLHPSQRELATREFNGPVKVTGSAGTGKTVVAMHRARHLARLGRRVLLTSFVTTLCENLRRNLALLCTPEELDRITVTTVHSQALELVKRVEPNTAPVNDEDVRPLVRRFGRQAAPELEEDLLVAEWEHVVHPRALSSWDEYRDADRRGRGRPLNVRERRRVWDVVELVQQELELTGRRTWTGLSRRARELIEQGQAQRPYDAVIVDELQDLNPADIELLAALAARPGRPADLMLVGDAGQRIYAGSFSLRSLGVDVRGRSRVLRINYRTTEQIRRAADRILGVESDDLDGGIESRAGTRSLLRGPEPVLRGFASELEEAEFIVSKIKDLVGEGLAPEEIAVFARTARALDPIEESLKRAGIPVARLARPDAGGGPAGVNFGSMHRAKGLEFRVVFVAGCREGLVPLASRLSRINDPGDRAIESARELSLLYVSLTRARDEAFVTWHNEPSPFLERLAAGGNAS